MLIPFLRYGLHLWNVPQTHLHFNLAIFTIYYKPDAKLGTKETVEQVRQEAYPPKSLNSIRIEWMNMEYSKYYGKKAGKEDTEGLWGSHFK